MPVSSGLRFRIIRPHTRGGLGEVYLALDEELQRQVALKRIQEHHADDPESRERFLREAIVTGALEHPGIVPVYGLGEYADGRPFYAMRFIRGESFKDAVDRFHQASSAGLGRASRSLEFRQLLSRFIAVCNAVAYAHSQGILHRDLKPENIMLGSFGETLVVDWGIAKTLDDCQPRGAGDETVVEVSPMTDSELTQVGRMLGTPQYMSPEQAAGLVDRLTPASDVYSLGATLYYLLTGKAPFAGLEADLVLLLAQEADFPPPRKRDPQVCRALEAICLKAMARRPEDRYPSARALADDLEHWLGDEAVLAYPERVPERLWRWARRHRTRVTITAGCMALAATVAVAWALLAAAETRELLEQQRADRLQEFAEEKSRLQQSAEDRRQEAENQRSRAKRSEALARRYLYFSRINLADRAWQEAQIARMRALLEEERRSQQDLIGFEWHYLWRLQHSSLFTLEGHAGPVVAVVFSPDGKRLASGSEDRTFRIWNAETGQLLARVREHAASVARLAFSPDGRLLASGCYDGTIKIWRLTPSGIEDDSPLVTFRGHAAGFICVAFSPDGRLLASGSQDKTIKLWQIPPIVSSTPSPPGSNQRNDQTLPGREATMPLYTLADHRSRINCIVFSPDGRRLASASGETSDVFRPGEVKLWDLAERRVALELNDHTATVTGLAFSPDGKYLATGSYDRTIKIWDLAMRATGKARSPLRTLHGHGKAILDLVFSRDGNHLASAGQDRTVGVWNPWVGEEVLRLRGHTDEVNAVALSPDGRRVASGSEDKTVRVWDATTSQETQTLEGHEQDVNCVAVDPSGRRLATASDDGTVGIWDAAAGKSLFRLSGHRAGANSVAFHPGGRWLASGAQDGAIKIWDLAGGTEVATWNGQGGIVNTIAFSPDGRNLATCHEDGMVRIWTAPGRTEFISFDNKPRLALLAHKHGALGVAFSPDGRLLASGGRDATAIIWDPASGARLRTLTGHEARVTGVAFSPDGRRLATASADSTIRLWSAADGEMLHTLKGHVRMVAAVCFTPDGSRLASASDDQTVKIWDPATGEEALTLRGHADTVTSIAFSPDGRWLASGSDDWTVKIWNAAPLGSVPRGSPRP
jgi:eukaryotic-like serine/threonine-protein kinase